ncbi:hypothetical protein ACFX2I_027173 [Malus domestica]
MLSLVLPRNNGDSASETTAAQLPFIFLKRGTKNITANNHSRYRRSASAKRASDPDPKSDRYNHVESSRANRSLSHREIGVLVTAGSVSNLQKPSSSLLQKLWNLRLRISVTWIRWLFGHLFCDKSHRKLVCLTDRAKLK